MSQNGGDLSRRGERIEQLMEVLLTRHLEFEDEHKKLLAAQVLLADAQCKTEGTMNTLSESLIHLSSRVDALVDVVDGMVRRPPEV